MLSHRGPVGPPATTSHVESSALEREAMGIPESLVRYSTGIEHADDLISDLDYALSAASALSARPRIQSGALVPNGVERRRLVYILLFAQKLD